MIDSVNFTNIINLIIESFKINLIITDEIDKNIHILAESNFKCYQANIEQRFFYVDEPFSLYTAFVHIQLFNNTFFI